MKKIWKKVILQKINSGHDGQGFLLFSSEVYMAYKVSDACVNCGACDSECPVEAISEKDGKRWIDPEKCSSCGACAGVCPVEAISE